MKRFYWFLKTNQNERCFYKFLNKFIKNLSECFVLQDFVHEFKHIDIYTKELKKLMELRKTASLKYADKIDLSEYKQSLVNILDKYVDAVGVELLTKQINITDRKQFDEAIASLGTAKSKAEAIAAQTDRIINEQMDTDPEFYERFSRKIADILHKMREAKLADIEALKQLKLIQNDVVNKKDVGLPSIISEQKGSDVYYRNLKECFQKDNVSEDVYVNIILDIFNLLKKEAIVDWSKNLDVKRRMMNVIDDYLYDVVKKEKNIDLSDGEMKFIITKILELAENNHETLS